MTRYQRVKRALEQAHSDSGDHWKSRELAGKPDAPRGEPMDITPDLDADPASNAESRDERATELEAKRERKQRIAGQLAGLPAGRVQIC